MTSGSTGSHFPSWQLAILMGAPVAIGLGYLYMRSSSNRTKQENEQKLAALGKKTLSIDDATADEDSTTSLDPFERAKTYKNEGNSLFKNGKYDEAISMYRKAIEECPPDKTSDIATYYQNCAAAYEQLKRWSKVKQECTKALELNPKYIKALYRRARAYENTNDLEECLEDITAVCILEAFENQASLLMADRILKELGQLHAQESFKTRKPIMPSNSFMKSYFSSFSEDPFKIATMNRNGTEPAKGFIRAKNALKSEDYDAIIPACTEEIETSESESQYKMEALVLRGTFYLLIGRPNDALLDFAVVISNNEASTKVRINALIKRGTLYMQQEKVDLCIQDFRTAVELDDKNADIYHHRGQVHLLMNEIEEARLDFGKAVELNPNFAIACVQKIYTEHRYAFAMKDVNKVKEVADYFEDAIKKFPNCTECYTLYAQVLCDQRQYPKADSFFAKAIESEPHNATVHVHRGLLRLQWTQDVNSAIQMIKDAINIDPKCEFAYETLGTIEVQRGNLDQAVEMFEKAVVLAKTESEMIHLYSLRDAAVAQSKVAKKYGATLQSLTGMV